MRWLSNKKSVQPSTATPPKTSTSAKKPRILFEQNTNQLTAVEVDSHLVSIKKETEKPTEKWNKAHMKILLKETYVENQNWISSQPDEKMAPTLIRLPCYREITYVSNV